MALCARGRRVPDMANEQQRAGGVIANGEHERPIDDQVNELKRFRC